MLRTSYGAPIRKRPRPKMHKFHPILSHMKQDVCHDDHICNACMESFAADADYKRPGHVWSVEDGEIVFLEDVVVEHHLGRKLKESETVIHRNGDPKDNRFENLEVVEIPDFGAK